MPTTPDERAPIVVTNPYTGKPMNVEPLARFLSEFPEHDMPDQLCHAFRVIQLELTDASGADWIPELSIFNELLSRLIETYRGITLGRL